MRKSTSWSRASSGSALLLCALLSCTTRESRPAPAPSKPTQVTLFFATEVRGYLGPCGCSEAMQGGLSRAAFQVARAREEGHPVRLVVAGDGVFGDAAIPTEAVAQQERKAQALAAGWKHMGVDVYAPGPLDDARGEAFRTSLALPELVDGELRVFDGVGVVNARDVAQVPALAAKARKAGARFVAALVAQPLPALLRESAELQGVELLISTSSGGAFAAEESRLSGGSELKLAQVQSKGRSLLRVDVFLRDDGAVEWLRGSDEQLRELRTMDQRIELLRAQVNEPMLNEELKALRSGKLNELIERRAALAAAPLPVPEKNNAATLRLIALEQSFEKDAAVAELEKQYDADVGLLNLAWAKEHGVSCEPATATRPGVVGTQLCMACHPAAGEVWKRTKHPQAFKALENEGKQYHLDCVSCHVTGWKLPQGVCRIDETAGRQEVGCESCHGPGSAHVAAPAKGNIKRVAEPATCVGCHDRENSPHFDFEAYLGKILGPGHGQPQ